MSRIKVNSFSKIEEWIKTLSDAVGISWARDADRGRFVDEDKEKIDTMVRDLRHKALTGFFENSNQGLRHAMREYWLLSYTIDHARLK